MAALSIAGLAGLAGTAVGHFVSTVISEHSESHRSKDKAIDALSKGMQQIEKQRKDFKDYADFLQEQVSTKQKHLDEERIRRKEAEQEVKTLKEKFEKIKVKKESVEEKFVSVPKKNFDSRKYTRPHWKSDDDEGSEHRVFANSGRRNHNRTDRGEPGQPGPSKFNLYICNSEKGGYIEPCCNELVNLCQTNGYDEQQFFPPSPPQTQMCQTNGYDKQQFFPPPPPQTNVTNHYMCAPNYQSGLHIPGIQFPQQQMMSQLCAPWQQLCGPPIYLQNRTEQPYFTDEMYYERISGPENFQCSQWNFDKKDQNQNQNLNAPLSFHANRIFKNGMQNQNNGPQNIQCSQGSFDKNGQKKNRNVGPQNIQCSQGSFDKNGQKKNRNVGPQNIQCSQGSFDKNGQKKNRNESGKSSKSQLNTTVEELEPSVPEFKEEEKPLPEEKKKENLKSNQKKYKQNCNKRILKEKGSVKPASEAEIKLQEEGEAMKGSEDQRKTEKEEKSVAQENVLSEVEAVKHAEQIVLAQTHAKGQSDSVCGQEYAQTEIKILLKNGRVLTQYFGTNELLSAVRWYVETNRTDRYWAPCELKIHFPLKVFSVEDYKRSLAVLGLVPSAVLTAVY